MLMDDGRNRKKKIGKFKLGPKEKTHIFACTYTHWRCRARFWLKSKLVIDSAGCSIHPSMKSQLQPVYNNLSPPQYLCFNGTGFLWRSGYHVYTRQVGLSLWNIRSPNTSKVQFKMLCTYHSVSPLVLVLIVLEILFKELQVLAVPHWLGCRLPLHYVTLALPSLEPCSQNDQKADSSFILMLLCRHDGYTKFIPFSTTGQFISGNSKGCAPHSHLGLLHLFLFRQTTTLRLTLF